MKQPIWPCRSPDSQSVTSQSGTPLDWWQSFIRSESVFNRGISAETSCEARIGGSLCALLSSVDLYGCCDRLGARIRLCFRVRQRVWAWRRLEGRRTRSRWCCWGRAASAKHRWCYDTARTNSTTNTSPLFRWESHLIYSEADSICAVLLVCLRLHSFIGGFMCNINKHIVSVLPVY